jgi:hypothetical protein
MEDQSMNQQNDLNQFPHRSSNFTSRHLNRALSFHGLRKIRHANKNENKL